MKKKVCIAGEGPAGLTLATKLASSGHEVIVFEKKSRGDAITYYNWLDSVDLNSLMPAGFPEPCVQGEGFGGDGVKSAVPGRGLYLPRLPDPNAESYQAWRDRRMKA